MNLNFHTLTGLCLIAGTSFAQPQEADSNELERRNGFKSIQLNAPVDSIKGAQLKKKSKELKTLETLVYEVNDPDLEKIGEVKVHKVQVSAFQGMIYRIEVITEKNPELMKALEKAFGKASYSVRTGIYSWRAPSLSLTFTLHNRNEFILTYNSYTVFRKMHEAKGEKVTEIADEL